MCLLCIMNFMYWLDGYIMSTRLFNYVCTSLNEECILRHFPESIHPLLYPSGGYIQVLWQFLTIWSQDMATSTQYAHAVVPESEYRTEEWHRGSRGSRETARLRKVSSDRWNLNLKLMSRVLWLAMLSLLMKAEGNRSGHGPNRCSECSLIHVLSASYGASTLMTFKGQFWWWKEENYRIVFACQLARWEKLNRFLLKGI